jgi:hypothetical protein
MTTGQNGQYYANDYSYSESYSQMRTDTATQAASSAEQAALVALARALRSEESNQTASTPERSARPDSAAERNEQGVHQQPSAAVVSAGKAADTQGIVAGHASSAEVDWITGLNFLAEQTDQRAAAVDLEASEGIALFSTETEELPSRQENLLAGAVPFDLASLERSVDRFFSHLGEVAPSVSSWRTAAGWAMWLGAGAAMTAVFEAFRRRAVVAMPASGYLREGLWAGDPELGLLPTGDES